MSSDSSAEPNRTDSKGDATRRDFVKAAGIVTAANAVSAFRARASPQVSYGVIGTGERGCYLLRHMTRLGNGRCAAVCDIEESNLKSGAATAGTNPRGYADYRELLARKDVEAIVIATPLYTHFPITRDALLAGKHVFCENCLVFRLEEAEALRALADEKSQQVIQTGLQRRYSQFYQTARLMAVKGLLGSVTHIIAQWHRNPGWRMKAYPARQRERNWVLYREYSGGLASEMVSHQIDIANWVFGSQPEYVVGVGGLEFLNDGRDTYDNIQLIFKYPRGQKLICTAISTNQQLPLFDGRPRAEHGERILGTGATVEITIGADDEPPIGLWYYEPRPEQLVAASEANNEKTIASATVGSFGYGRHGYPIILDADQFHDDDSFLAKEMKHARRWLYAKGLAVPVEGRHPVELQMESFFECCHTGARPKAGLQVGLANSTAVILSNLALDTGRRVYFNEINTRGTPK